MCEFCEPDKKNKCKPLVECIDRLNGYEEIKLHHSRPCKALPNRDEWHLQAGKLGVFLYAQINYCPMCGRNLRRVNERT